MKLKDIPGLSDFMPASTNILEDIDAPNAVSSEQQSALQYACYTGLSGVVKLLLEHGANPNLPADTNHPLLLALQANDTASIKFLFDSNVNLSQEITIDTTRSLHAPDGKMQITIFDLLIIHIASGNIASSENPPNKMIPPFLAYMRVIPKLSPGSVKEAESIILKHAFENFFLDPREKATSELEKGLPRELVSLVMDYSRPLPNSLSEEIRVSMHHVQNQLMIRFKEAVVAVNKKEKLDQIAELTPTEINDLVQLVQSKKATTANVEKRQENVQPITAVYNSGKKQSDDSTKAKDNQEMVETYNRPNKPTK